MSTRPSTGQQRRRAAQRAAEARREQERLAGIRRRRRRLILAGGTAAVVVIATVVAVTLSIGSPSKSTPGSTHSAASTTIATAPFVPGAGVQLSDSGPPWALPADARPFIAAAGLQVLGKEALAVHYHAHVDIIVNGVAQTVPAGVGFVIQNSQETGITVLHTHDTSGVIHIESPTSIPYTLGQVFAEWGVRLGPAQLGGLTDTGGNALRVYVDGHQFAGNPATIVLRSHQEIALWYGQSTTTPSVPATYRFPTGE